MPFGVFSLRPLPGNLKGLAVVRIWDPLPSEPEQYRFPIGTLIGKAQDKQTGLILLDRRKPLYFNVRQGGKKMSLTMVGVFGAHVNPRGYNYGMPDDYPEPFCTDIPWSDGRAKELADQLLERIHEVHQSSAPCLEVVFGSSLCEYDDQTEFRLWEVDLSNILGVEDARILAAFPKD